jgi:predicted PurR-regulated permease PerM
MAQPAPGDRTGSTADRSTAGTTPDLDPAEQTTAAPPPDWKRGEKLMGAMRRVSIVAAQALVIAAAVLLLWYVLGWFWVILLPIIIGLLITTMLWPATRFLRKHRWPPALAAATVLLLFLGLIAGIIGVIAPQVVGQVEDLADGVTGGLQQVQTWLAGPPFNLGDGQVDDAVDSIINTVQSNAQNIAGYAVTGVTAIGNVLVNLLLALVLVFFFLKDGPRWVPWLAAQTGPRAAPHVAALSAKSWSTLSEFIRQQALVGFIDAFFIGIGLWILDVPLVLPLAVLTFFGAFVPIIGAVVAGAFAVLIALVDQGFTTALIVLGIVLLVQQLEGNVLQPIIQGRGLNLHAAVVILAVTAGSSLYGIIGAFLAVPVTALIAVVYRYTRDALDGREPAASEAGIRAVLSPEPGAGGGSTGDSAPGTKLVAEPAGSARD